MYVKNPGRHIMKAIRLSYILLIFWCCNIARAYPVDICRLRALYYMAAENECDSKKFAETMNKISVDNDPILLCYKGLSQVMESKYACNPFTKLSCFNFGTAMIDKAIVKRLIRSKCVLSDSAYRHRPRVFWVIQGILPKTKK